MRLWFLKPKKRACPKCRKLYTEYPSLSRQDNKTEICYECGTREALEDLGLIKSQIEIAMKSINLQHKEYEVTHAS